MDSSYFNLHSVKKYLGEAENSPCKGLKCEESKITGVKSIFSFYKVMFRLQGYVQTSPILQGQYEVLTLITYTKIKQSTNL